MPGDLSVAVHVIGNGCEAVLKLHCPDRLPELRENYIIELSSGLAVSFRPHDAQGLERATAADLAKI